MAKKRGRRKHYYHNGPFYLYTNKELDTPAVTLLEIRKESEDQKLKDWYTFVDKYGYRAEPLAVSKEDDIIAIGGCILDDNKTLSTYYYKHIYKLFEDGYNPYCDKIPLERLPDNLVNVIKKKQKYIKNMYYYRQEYRDLDLIVQYNRKDIQNIVSLDLKNYKHVIRLYGDNTYIYVRGAKNIEQIVCNLNELEQELSNKLYPNKKNEELFNVWSVSRADARKIYNNKKTNINFKDYHMLFCIFANTSSNDGGDY